MASRAVSFWRQIGAIGESRDGRATVEQRAGADVGLPALKVLLTGIGEGRLEDVRAFLQFADGLAKAGLPNLVSADDELRRLVEMERLKQRQGRDQRSAVRDAAMQGRQSQGGRGAHAAAGANQPQSDSSCTHDGGSLCFNPPRRESGTGGNRRATSGWDKRFRVTAATSATSDDSAGAGSPTAARCRLPQGAEDRQHRPILHHCPTSERRGQGMPKHSRTSQRTAGIE